MCCRGPQGPVCGGPNSPVNNGPLVGQGTGFTPNSKCVPWNVWVPNGVTPAALAFLSVPLLANATTEEYVADASVTGDLGKYGVKLPWADSGLQVNIGSEWRQESSSFLPDYLSQQGSAAGSGGATPPVSGGFTVKEVFTEMRLPIAQHLPFAEDLSLDGGYRYSKYSEGFDTNTYKIGAEWAPVRDIRFRGGYQRAVRAPNIGELYTPQAVGLDGSIDPCAAPKLNATTLTNGTTLAQCEATGVTPATVRQHPPGQGQPVQRAARRKSAAATGKGRFVHDRLDSDPALDPELHLVGRLLQHQDRERDRRHRGQHHPP